MKQIHHVRVDLFFTNSAPSSSENSLPDMNAWQRGRCHRYWLSLIHPTIQQVTGDVEVCTAGLMPAARRGQGRAQGWMDEGTNGMSLKMFMGWF